MTSLLQHSLAKSDTWQGEKRLGLIGMDFVRQTWTVQLSSSRCAFQLTVSTATLGAIFSPISLSLSAKNCLSSVALTDSIGVPRTQKYKNLLYISITTVSWHLQYPSFGSCFLPPCSNTSSCETNHMKMCFCYVSFSCKSNSYLLGRFSHQNYYTF